MQVNIYTMLSCYIFSKCKLIIAKRCMLSFLHILKVQQNTQIMHQDGLLLLITTNLEPFNNWRAYFLYKTRRYLLDTRKHSQNKIKIFILILIDSTWAGAQEGSSIASHDVSIRIFGLLQSRLLCIPILITLTYTSEETCTVE